MKKLVRLGLVLFIFSIIITGVSGEAKKKKIKLSKTKLSVELGKSKKLKLKNAKGKVKWSSSDNKTVVVRKGKVTGKRLGTAVVTAKAGKKKYNCRVSVTIAKERLCGYSEYIFIMKDGSKVSVILSGGLKYEGKRYAVDSELGLRLGELFRKYGVLIKK